MREDKSFQKNEVEDADFLSELEEDPNDIVFEVD
jgi:hypothetical protein